MNDHKQVVVFSTVESPEEASMISRHLVEQGLAACVNIVPHVKSVYIWKGKLREEEEWQLVIKTQEALMDKVIAAVKRLHSYDVPELIALPIIAGNPPYLDWIKESTLPL
ncbi:MAG: divalent-cation tolerance protein CutA [Deltaproteobacteria bacterium]|nr:divalent-cation tolerance protein CutA [Deltaproteobacteria bacterium]